DGHLVEAGLPEPGLPPHAGLVTQAPGHRIAHDDQAEIVGRHAGIAEGLVHDLVGHGVGRLVAPAHVAHAGAEDGHVGGLHAETPASACRCPSTNAARSWPKCSTAGDPATITRMWRAPASAYRPSCAAQVSGGPATRWRWKALGGKR